MSVLAQHLIATFSTLPSAPSPLDSSISALRSSISALEASIEALNGRSVFWETLLLPFSALVVIGVGLEVWALLWDHGEAMADWRRGIVLPPERPSTRKLWLGIVATLLVVIGVAGELATSGRIASINGQLRTKNSNLRSASDQLLALITQEAGEAATSAHSAIGDSQAAQAAASDAQLKATNARREADSFEQDIVSAKIQATQAENDLAASLQRTARLEQQLSWRTVTPEQRSKLLTLLASSTRLLMPLSGLKINITYLNSDAEAQEYADDLKRALDGLGAEITGPSGVMMMGGPGFRIPEGVILTANPFRNPRVNSLIISLNGAGIAVSGVREGNMDEHDVAILVGAKPHSPSP
jgi:hypothetical protein